MPLNGGALKGVEFWSWKVTFIDLICYQPNLFEESIFDRKVVKTKSIYLLALCSLKNLFDNNFVSSQ